MLKKIMPHLNAVTLKQLRALAAFSQHGSVTLAAGELNLTVPAVSSQLKALEENFGGILLKRDKGGQGALTRQGEEVLKAISRIEAALARCHKSVRAMNSGRSGFVALGVVSTGKYFAPQLVAWAKKVMPHIRIDLKIGNRQEIISALENNSLDLAIMGRPPRFPEVKSTALGEHPHLLIAAPEHPLLDETDISPERLLDETFIKREPGSGTRILMERYLDRIGEGRTYDWLEFNTNETIKQAVIADLGIALISGHTVIDELKSGRIATISMPGLPILRRWFLVHPANEELSPVAETLHSFLVEQEENYLPRLPELGRT